MIKLKAPCCFIKIVKINQMALQKGILLGAFNIRLAEIPNEGSKKLLIAALTPDLYYKPQYSPTIL